MIWKWGTSDSSFKGKQRYSKSHWKDSCMLPTHWWAFLCTVEPRYNGNGYKGEPDITVKHSVPMDSCSSPYDFNSRPDIKVKYFRSQWDCYIEVISMLTWAIVLWLSLSYPHWQSENALYYKSVTCLFVRLLVWNHVMGLDPTYLLNTISGPLVRNPRKWRQKENGSFSQWERILRRESCCLG